MRLMTICMFSNLFPPIVSGSSTQASALARELTLRGHKVLVITAHIDPASPECEEIEGVTVYRMPALRFPRLAIALNFPWLSYTFTLSNIDRIGSIVKQHSPDVLHLHNHMFDLGLAAALMRKKNDLPLVTTIHTVIRHSQFIYNLFLIPADRLILKRLIIDQSDQLICPDINIHGYVKESFHRSDSVIVPYGIDPPQHSYEDQVQQLKIKHKVQGKRVILSLGHVHEIRNRKDLIEAMPEVLHAFPDTVLLIVGAVTTTSTLNLVRKLDVEHAVVFAGPISHDHVPEYFAIADIEAHWLNQEEPARTSLGIASLEAMSAGKVVLAAANPDTYGPGLLRNGENIIIVEPGKPEKLAQIIIELLQNDKQRESIGQQARNIVSKHFSWDSICEQTLQVYQKAIQRDVA